MLRIEVANTGTWIEPGGRGTTSTGIGLDNLRQRLARYYPDAHEMQLGPEGEWVVARLNLTRKAERGTRSQTNPEGGTRNGQ